MKRIFGIMCATILLAACKQHDYQQILHSPNLYCKTVHELNQVVMGNNFTPVVASRNYAYANIAGYEAIAAGYPQKFTSLAGQLNQFKIVAKPLPAEKIDFEYASLLAFCKVGQAVTFPEGSMKYYIDSLHTLAIEHGMPADVITGTENYAGRLAASVIKWSKGDNYLKTRSASKFSVKNIPGRWVPTPPSYAAAVEPHWSEIRPMVMDSAAQFKVPPPPVFNIADKSSAYYHEVNYIITATANLTPDQQHIADFWDDNPGKLNVMGHVQFITKKFSPPGHWMSITGIAAQQAKANFGTTVCAFAKTAIALFDGFIQCWNAKYSYNTARPETVINKYFNADWRPRLQTPPFPEYTCGHSTISSAAAEALTSVFGDKLAFKDTSELEFGIKSRSFASFRKAAEENNWARFYGGLHFHNSCIVANQSGKQVGSLIANKLQMQK
ncbi:PAP2 superfamily protein [Mucilaginibacter gracilis]|uniref:PAP2 superfamily protein n=1 Tax=Mucilaginibacter gracilis TaxID=423350 RepID=A0A495IXK1_9SPHI|nr:vanadium-dependent haloperoxidase [Mucilaginibacter gracilis]RKR80784.1 PAP2 superfamily protein [Mucilaginibacter gracilis]